MERILLIFFAVSSIFAQGKEPLDIRKMHDWRIVVAADAIESEKYAAQEFQTFFKQATGFQLGVNATGTATKNVFIGPSEALRKSNLGFVMDKEYQPEELRIVVRTDNIAITGGRPRGVLYGVYDFLEGILGIRFLTADHTYTPEQLMNDSSSMLTELKSRDYSFDPRFSYRMLYYPETLHQIHFGRQVRLNATGIYMQHDAKLENQIGGFNRGGVILHSIGGWLNVPFKEHPEYYAIRDGKAYNKQICMSHPDVIRIVTEKVVRALPKMQQDSMIAVAQMDSQACDCQRCKAFAARHGGARSAVVLNLVNHIAREVAKTRPDVTIGTLAYAWSRHVPTNMKAEPNVRIQYATYHACMKHGYDTIECPINLEISKEIQDWANICNSLVYWTYALDFRDYLLPPVRLASVGSEIRCLAKNRGTGLFFQGPGSGRGTGMSDMMVYILSRMMWNPDLEVDVLQNEFLDLHYGRAAKPIRQFLAKVQRAVLDWPDHENCNAPFHAYGLTEQLGREGITIFDEALKLAESAEVRNRVEKASICAYRLALGEVWYGKTPTNLTPETKAEYRRIAYKMAELYKKHGVTEHGEGWPVSGAFAKVHSALGMAPDKSF